MFSNIICFLAGIVVYHLIITMNKQERNKTDISCVGVFEPIQNTPPKPKKKNAKMQGNSTTSV